MFNFLYRLIPRYKHDIIFSKRFWKFLRQRITRGWDDSETWSLDSKITEFILPRLKRFKEIRKNIGSIPCSVSYEVQQEYIKKYNAKTNPNNGEIEDKKLRKKCWNEATKRYDFILQQMVDLFQDIYDEEENDYWREKWEKKAKVESKKQGKEIKYMELNNKFRDEGFAVFTKYFFTLWW